LWDKLALNGVRMKKIGFGRGKFARAEVENVCLSCCVGVK